MSGERPIEAVLLVHGAFTGPWIFEHWPPHFPGVEVSAVDLQLGLRPEVASMDLYVGTVVAEAGRLPFPLLLCGYGLGGLVAMMAAQVLRPRFLALLEPSPPAEVHGLHPEVEPVDGIDQPDAADLELGIRLRPESLRARLERDRGISVPSVPSPSMVVYGDDFPEDRGRAVARRYGSEELHIPGLRHVDLVADPRVPQAIARWIGLQPPSEEPRDA